MHGVVRLLVSLLLVPALLAAGPSSAQSSDPTQDPCVSPVPEVTMETIVLESGGETVTGCFAYGADGIEAAFTLVTMVHGFGHSVQGSWLPHIAETVQAAPGTAVVAMNFRDNYGFPIFMGAEDTIRGTLYAMEQMPHIHRTVLYSVSMGAAIGGTALHIAPGYNDGTGLWDHWFAIEPAANPLETYLEAKAISPAVPLGQTASEGMERDAGGTPAEEPEAWALRVPVLHAGDMKAAGLQDAVIVHGLYDGLVPYDQGREMNEALKGAHLPVAMYTVLRGAPDHTAGTTPTSHAGQPQLDPNEQALHLAGHGSEADREHIVTATGLERLFSFLNGHGITRTEEYLVDHAFGIERII